MPSVTRRIADLLDSLVYGFIVPFGVLYVFPRFLLGVEQSWGVDLPRVPALRLTGIVLMNLGGLLALVCAACMHLNGRQRVSPFSRPRVLVRRGPYARVRHPMMWSGNLVLIGQMLVYSSPLLALWLLVWGRFAAIYIARFEEPYLLRLFGDQYRDYCERTPRWFPALRRPASLKGG